MKENVDPADLLRPNAEFRKATEASMGSRLWTRDNEYGLFECTPLTKTQLSKSRSRERYFQSSITTLPGPSLGLNCVKTRQDERQASLEAATNARKKHNTNDTAFASHISTLAGATLASSQTQD